MADQLARVKELQAAGNAFYRGGHYDDARVQYSQAIALLEASLGAVVTTATDSQRDAIASVSQLFSNRAQTFIQERNFAAALHGIHHYTWLYCAVCAWQLSYIAHYLSMNECSDCTRALKYNPENEKANLRRLVALENLERFEVALTQVEAILERHGAREGSPALFQYAVTARRRLRRNMVKDKEAAANEIAQMGKMVHADQQLRINFGYVQSYVCILYSAAWFNCVLFVCGVVCATVAR